MKKLIFLVEDDSAIVDIYKLMMEKSGFTVEVFGLGKEVINAIKTSSKKPDMVLLDLILPDINGMEVLKEIRHNPATKDIKVFILTNQSDVKIDEGAIVRADKILIKAHVTPSDLVDTISEALN